MSACLHPARPPARNECVNTTAVDKNTPATSGEWNKSHFTIDVLFGGISILI